MLRLTLVTHSKVRVLPHWALAIGTDVTRVTSVARLYYRVEVTVFEFLEGRYTGVTAHFITETISLSLIS
jgi:hypothetical protein